MSALVGRNLCPPDRLTRPKCHLRSTCTPPTPTRYRQVIIQDGQVLAGTLCKKTLGAAPGGLVHITWMEYGPEAARALLSQVCMAGGEEGGCHLSSGRTKLLPLGFLDCLLLRLPASPPRTPHS